MKKIIFALLAVMFVSSFCFAEQPAAPVSQPTAKPIEIKTFAGKVDSVSIGDVAKKTMSEIVVVDEKGQKLTFAVRHSTVISAKDGKALTIADIKKDSKVDIEYAISAAGTNRAKTIKLAE